MPLISFHTCNSRESPSFVKNAKLKYHVRGIFGSGFNLANHINIAKLNVCHYRL